MSLLIQAFYCWDYRFKLGKKNSSQLFEDRGTQRLSEDSKRWYDFYTLASGLHLQHNSQKPLRKCAGTGLEGGMTGIPPLWRCR